MSSILEINASFSTHAQITRVNSGFVGHTVIEPTVVNVTRVILDQIATTTRLVQVILVKIQDRVWTGVMVIINVVVKTVTMVPIANIQNLVMTTHVVTLCLAWIYQGVTSNVAAIEVDMDVYVTVQILVRTIHVSTDNASNEEPACMSVIVKLAIMDWTAIYMIHAPVSLVKITATVAAILALVPIVSNVSANLDTKGYIANRRFPVIYPTPNAAIRVTAKRPVTGHNSVSAGEVFQDTSVKLKIHVCFKMNAKMAEFVNWTQTVHHDVIVWMAISVKVVNFIDLVRVWHAKITERVYVVVRKRNVIAPVDIKVS